MKKKINGWMSTTCLLICIGVITMISGCGSSSQSQPGNSAPAAGNFTVQSLINQTVEVDFLTHVTDADHDVESTGISIDSWPSHGTLVEDDVTGSFTYIPENDYAGEDSFTYSVQDNKGLASNSALVTLIIALDEQTEGHPPLVNSYSGIVISGETLLINLTTHISDEDNDVDLSTIEATEPLHGDLSPGASPGLFIYLNDTGFTGQDSFSYTVEDSEGHLSDPAEVTITVSPVIIPEQHAPVASSFSASGTSRQALAIDFSLHAHDEDNDIDFSTITITTPPSHGTLAVGTADKFYLYTAETGYVGEDSFSFTIRDSQGHVSGVAEATLSISLVEPIWDDAEWDTDVWAQ